MIFLNILKIIGFVLLGIIALILLIVLVLLIWPFKYRIEADYHEKFKVKAVVSFLFKLVRVIFTFEDMSPLLVAKIAWVEVYRNDFSDKEEEYPSEDDLFKDETDTGLSAEEQLNAIDAARKDSEGSLAADEEGQESEGTGPDSEKNDSEAGAEQSGEGTQETEGDNPDGESPEEEFGPSKEEIDEFMAEELPPQSPKSFIDEFFDNIENLFSQIRKKWYNLKRSSKELQKNIRYYSKVVRYYYKVLHYKSMQPAFQMVKKTLIGILKHVRPRKLRLYVHYGADNPADTAKVVAAYSMIYPYYRKQVRLDAEFNEAIIEGNGYIKGHFQLGVLAFFVIRAYLNKDVRKMIKLFTREGKKHG